MNTLQQNYRPGFLASVSNFLWISIAVLLLPCIAYAQQNVGIGTTTPNSSAVLDISSTNKGVLIPRVALTSTTAASPLAALVDGMMVYNTATAGTFPNNVVPGFYFCSGGKWQKVDSGWSTTGNAGTNAATHFIGTTDDQDVVFKRNNARAGLINNSRGSVSLGVLSLNPSATGYGNTVIGNFCMSANSIGQENTALGNQALRDNTTGSFNTGLGSVALINNTVGHNNIGIGFYALASNKAGNSGIAIGNSAQFNANPTTTLFLNTNISIGTNALWGSTTPANNTGLHNNVIGFSTMYNNSSGTRNNTLGTESLYNNTTGSANIAIGYRALYNNTTKSGNTAVGDSTLYNNGLGAIVADDGAFNTAIGSNALKSNTTGWWGTAVGYQALMKNTTGRFNTAVGYKALFENVTGSANAAFGESALTKTTSGGNAAFGVQALPNLTTGQINLALGWRAGFTNENGERNIFIGPEAGWYESGSNKLYIENSNADSTNALIFGNFASDKVRINGHTQSVYNVTFNDTPAVYGENDNSDYYGIGVQGKGGWKGVEGLVEGTGPNSYFGVIGSSVGNNTGSNYGIYGEAYGGTHNYAGYFRGDVAIGGVTPKKATGYMLSVDGKIAAEEVLVDLSDDWPDYVFKKDYDLKSLDEVKAHISEKGHLPNVPSAKEVEENGILLGNMNKVLIEKIEELTLYILQQEEKLKSYELRLTQLEKQSKKHP